MRRLILQLLRCQTLDDCRRIQAGNVFLCTLGDYFTSVSPSSCECDELSNQVADFLRVGVAGQNFHKCFIQHFAG